MECWKNNPPERPSFDRLRSMLHSMIRDEEQVRIKELNNKELIGQGTFNKGLYNYNIFLFFFLFNALFN